VSGSTEKWLCYFGIARSKRDGTRAETRFGLSAKRTSPYKSAGGVSSVDYWQSRSADQRRAIVYTVFRRTVQDYWLPTPFASFSFTSPPVRHRVPSGSERALKYDLVV